jgi:hypothetical protein
MKKFIYTISFLAIALAFGGTSALAQISTRIDAEIPFDFAVGGEVLEAGNYVMRLRTNNAGAEALEIRDAKNRIVYEAFILQNGDISLRKPKLIFDRVDGQPVLARIRLENKGFRVPVEKGANTTLPYKHRKRASAPRKLSNPIYI